jgi:hypothetical protein
MPDELTLPKSQGAGPGQFIMLGIVLLFSYLATLNLSHHTATVPSTLWLSLVGFVVVGGLIAERGPWGLAKAFLSEFAQREFAALKRLRGTPAICLGFEWHGRRFIQRTIPLDHIASIEWRSGQATAMTGRDMGDWSVFLRLDSSKPSTHPEKKAVRNRTLAVLTVGPPRAKEITEAFGASFIAFLAERGVQLTPAGESNVFLAGTASSSPPASTPPTPSAPT